MLLSLRPLKEVAKVKVERWCPGVVEELIGESEHKVTRKKYDTKLSIEDRLLSEATEELEKKRQFQLAATEQNSLSCLLTDNKGEQKVDMMFEGPKMSLPRAAVRLKTVCMVLKRLA